jgi:hypothetical protein
MDCSCDYHGKEIMVKLNSETAITRSYKNFKLLVWKHTIYHLMNSLISSCHQKVTQRNKCIEMAAVLSSNQDVQ